MPKTHRNRIFSIPCYALNNRSISEENVINYQNIRRLKFGRKLEDSAFINGKFHPTLQILFQYLFQYGKIPTNESILLSKEDKKLTYSFKKLAKRGKLFQISYKNNVTYAVLGVLKSYIKSLPKSPLCSRMYQDWSSLVKSLPNCNHSQVTTKYKTEAAIREYKRLLKRIPQYNCIFTKYLVVTLENMAQKCSSKDRGCLRLAEYFASVMLIKKPKSLKIQTEVETVMNFLILHAWNVFDDCDLTVSAIKKHPSFDDVS